MKKRNIFLFTSISCGVFCMLGVLLSTGCKKVETTRVNTASNSGTQSIIASDELVLNNEFDQAADDAIAVISNPKTVIQGADVDTSQINIGIITIYYNKITEPDGTKQRTGSDSIHQNLLHGKIVPWGTPGTTASMTLGCINSPGYEVLYLTNNTSLTITGTATLTNINGGLIQNVSANDSLAVRIRAKMSFTYNDNAIKVELYSWNLNQIRTFTRKDTILNAAATADSTVNGIANVGTWGVDRYGDNFYASISKTIVQNISNLKLSYNPQNGIKNIENITEPITSIYGVDQNGNSTNAYMPYGFFITWINNGGQAQNVIGYYY